MNRHIISFEKVAELISTLPIGHHSLTVHDCPRQLPNWKVLFEIQKILTRRREVTVELDFSQVESISEIHSHSLVDCGNIFSITLPHGISVIEQNAFYRCDGLQHVFFSNTEGWKKTQNLDDHEDFDVSNSIQNAEYLKSWNASRIWRGDTPA